MEHRVTEKGPLLDGQGRLYEAGYATSLIKEYDRRAIKAPGYKIKEWDYYYIGNGHYGIALTIADNSYMGLMSASLLDLDQRTEATKSVMTLFPNGATGLPKSSVSGDVGFHNSRIDIEFRNDGQARQLSCRFPNFCGGQTLSAEIRLTEAPEDSMVILTPYRESPTAFYYNQKINCLRARGRAELGGRTYTFDPADSFGGLDWGRGVWTYKNTWYWSSASGLLNGERFGFNLGYGFGNTEAASENMLFYRGRAHKLDRVVFNIPLDERGREKYLEPWTITSNDQRLNLGFRPLLDRRSHTNALIIESDQHQVFGRFFGQAVLDDGTVLEIKDLTGFAEKVRNRW